MQSNVIRPVTLVLAIILIVMPACSPPSGTTAVPPAPTQDKSPLIPVAGPLATATVLPTTTPAATSTAPVIHSLTPASPRAGKLIYDVESSGTGPEKRAPYGDSYDINRLERPFTQDMEYVSALDISTFTVTKDNDWWYVAMELVGIDPGNTLAINYGVELDLDHDGFGDYLIWAHPPYTNQWETTPVQIYQDNNHNTAGLSIGKSDAPFTADGYETLVFDGQTGGTDPDVAWIRVETGSPATVQFAFKQSWSGNIFMLGVLADAGLKDPQKLDYVDRFSLEEAGSPVRESKYYPLKALFLVDNTCRDAFGFQPSSYEPQLCPVPVPPSRTPDPDAQTGANCPDPGPNVCRIWDPVQCKCLRK